MAARQALAALVLVAIVAGLANPFDTAARYSLGEPANEGLGFVAVPDVAPSAVAIVASTASPARPVVHPPRPRFAVPEPHLIAVPVPTPRSGALEPSRRDARKVTGTASYYCNADTSRARVSRCTRGHPDVGGEQLFAAVRRDLLARLRGHRVLVTSTDTGRTVEVTVIDCNCGAGANLIDLYGDAFARLAPLSRGTVNVTLTWLR